MTLLSALLDVTLTNNPDNPDISLVISVMTLVITVLKNVYVMVAQ
jgi:hypothetical protein